MPVSATRVLAAVAGLGCAVFLARRWFGRASCERGIGKRRMRGELSVYSGGRVVFRSGPARGIPVRGCVVFVGGLTDGLLATPYVAALGRALASRGYELLQPLLSSSYSGYGTSSLATDASEIAELIQCLRSANPKVQIALMGHSTGTQDAVAYCAAHHSRKIKPDCSVPSARVDAVILQAPVSDREWMQSDDPSKREMFLKMSKDLISRGKGLSLLPREADHVPITAYRYHSLASYAGDDDMFSSDLSDAELRSKLQVIDVPALFIFSGKDQYVPDHVDAKTMATRLSAAVGPNARGCVLPDANHECKGADNVAKLVAKVVSFLENVM